MSVYTGVLSACTSFVGRFCIMSVCLSVCHDVCMYDTQVQVLKCWRMCLWADTDSRLCPKAVGACTEDRPCSSQSTN